MADDIITTIRKRMAVAEERDRIAKEYLDRGGIILTKHEAEKLLRRIDSLLTENETLKR